MTWFVLFLMTIQIVVRDSSGAATPGARVVIEDSGGVIVWSGATDIKGESAVPVLSEGDYVVRIVKDGFGPVRKRIRWPLEKRELSFDLFPARLSEAVTVTASRGVLEEVREAFPLMSVVASSDAAAAPSPTIGTALQGLPGVLLQQTSSSQASPFLRGLTGYQVLNLIDGIRLNNATFRSGPNQYLAFVAPAQTQAIDVALGPSGVLYGSDAMGGTINVRTVEPAAVSAARTWHGDLESFAGFADASAGGSAHLSLGTAKQYWLFGGSHRRYNAIRSGGGIDSHNVFTRYFGMHPQDVRTLIGSRQKETHFTQSGLETKFVRTGDRQTVTIWFQNSRQNGARNTKDLLGGRGHLLAELDPQRLDFFYTRWERRQVGPLENIQGSFSVNVQTDGSARQGLSYADPITQDESKARALGYVVHATAAVRRVHSVVFGMEDYNEFIVSRRAETNPLDGVSIRKRPLYPDGSRYNTLGAFINHVSRLADDRLRLSGGLRVTRVSLNTRADSLGVIASSQTFQDATFNASAAWNVAQGFGVSFIAARGFRAPNLNDLGALGLNDLGFEVPSADAAAVSAWSGDSAGENALSSELRVRPLRSESLLNLETGFRFEGGPVYARLHVYKAGYRDPIVRRTLLFEETNVPAEIAGVPVTPLEQTPAQRLNGFVTVAPGGDRRAVKTFVNAGRQRYSGVDGLFQVRPAAEWNLEATYSFIAGTELDPKRPVRRLPPQAGGLTLRYNQTRWWTQANVSFAGAQDRLNGGDFGDERIGAERSRRDIAAVFNGTRFQSHIQDGVFIPTGETLLQIQDRVLPGLDETARLPLYRSTPGYVTFNIQAGFSVSERTQLSVSARNIFDRNYRVHGSGIDGPGRDLFMRWAYRF